MCYLCCLEEPVYERKLSELILSLVVKIAHLVMHDDGAYANPAIELVVLHWPLDNVWFCCAYEHWKMDVDFIFCRRVPPRVMSFSLHGTKWNYSLYRRLTLEVITFL